MSAYFVARITIKDRETYAAYEKRFMAVFRQFDGELLAVEDSPRVLEGQWSGTRTVLLRFPDETALRRWYDSPAYQEIARLRHAGADADIAILSARDDMNRPTTSTTASMPM